MLVWSIALWNLLWEFKGHVKLRGVGGGIKEVIHEENSKKNVTGKRNSKFKILKTDAYLAGQDRLVRLQPVHGQF